MCESEKKEENGKQVNVIYTLFFTFARALLLSPYINNAVFMTMNFQNESVYVKRKWNISNTFSLYIVYTILFTQFISCLFLIFRKFVIFAVSCLFLVIITQNIIFELFLIVNYAVIDLALFGGLLLLIVEASYSDKYVFVKTQENNYIFSITQLLGRILLVCMFMILLRFNHNKFDLLHDFVVCMLAILIIFGYKTKFSASVLVFWLLAFNLNQNQFWKHKKSLPLKNFYQQEFLHILSVVGGFCMLFKLGPGKISVDETKKLK